MKVITIFEKLFKCEFDEDLSPTQEQFDLIDEIVEGYQDEDLCELLLRKAPDDYCSDKLASYLSMLVWQTSDNGAKVCQTLSSWLETGDARRVSIASSKEFEVQLPIDNS